mmetsp:Transcript_54250/g.100282  ORF Transcript_54250/g.100282 Transcript_54250/m.100282 type:complete len:198 (-) Transcript_54250:88-681(-)
MAINPVMLLPNLLALLTLAAWSHAAPTCPGDFGSCNVGQKAQLEHDASLLQVARSSMRTPRVDLADDFQEADAPAEPVALEVEASKRSTEQVLDAGNGNNKTAAVNGTSQADGEPFLEVNYPVDDNNDLEEFSRSGKIDVKMPVNDTIDEPFLDVDFPKNDNLPLDEFTRNRAEYASNSSESAAENSTGKSGNNTKR